MDATASQLARMAVAEVFLAIMFLVALGKAEPGRQPLWQGTVWSLRKCLLAGAGFALLLRVPLLIALLTTPEAISSLAALDPVWQIVLNVRQQFGVVAAFWLVVLAAPVVEEFLFRGVILKAFSNHISFGWANTLQAAMFAAIHFNPAAVPVLFTFGAIAGWLSRRSGGLLSPIILHLIFNLAAAIVVLR